MDKFFVILFSVLAVVCLGVAVMAGRSDYLVMAAMCAVAALAGRAEMKKERR